MKKKKPKDKKENKEEEPTPEDLEGLLDAMNAMQQIIAAHELENSTTFYEDVEELTGEDYDDFELDEEEAWIAG